MSDKLAIIIQARSGSSRLPNKVLLPFYNHFSILDLIIKRLKKNKHNADLIIATSTNINDNKIAEFAKKHNILVFKGDENNVLDRFIKCAETFGYKKLIRVCADNPFIIAKYVENLTEIGINNEYDYISYKDSYDTPVIKTHFGLFVEFVKLDALKKAAKSTDDKLYLEHVTNYIYTHPEKYNLKLLPLPDLINNRNDLRFTCDTIDDFKILKSIYAIYINTYSTDEIELEKLLKIVDSNKEILNMMNKGIEQFRK